MTLPDGSLVAYEIDGHGRRVGKRVNGTKRWGLLYRDDLRPIAELEPNGALRSIFVYGSLLNAPDVIIKSTGTYRVVTDHVGSVRLVVDASTGAIAQRIDYDEFGSVLADTNPGFQPFGFAGGIYDPDTGLVRFGARDYDASAGRWTAKDPILFDGRQTNLYAYADNDPVNFIDPSGEIVLLPLFTGLGNGLLDAGLEYAAQQCRGETTNWGKVAAEGALGFGSGVLAGSAVALGALAATGKAGLTVAQAAAGAGLLKGADFIADAADDGPGSAASKVVCEALDGPTPVCDVLGKIFEN